MYNNMYNNKLIYYYKYYYAYDYAYRDTPDYTYNMTATHANHRCHRGTDAQRGPADDVLGGVRRASGRRHRGPGREAGPGRPADR